MIIGLLHSGMLTYLIHLRVSPVRTPALASKSAQVSLAFKDRFHTRKGLQNLFMMPSTASFTARERPST